MKKIRTLVVAGACLALVLGLFSVLSTVEAKKPGGGGGPCICPMVYAPVICDDGKIYSNSCVAACKHATGCEPYGPGPIEL